ncbi:solute carrier family 6 (neurotransmitter transporter, GABA) member 1 [Geosmithia morbida]|uniref:Solute carrier family 6 (Neurotransmitter transporter, GABA) member 1 n=1 Tax=Geosmithia morbida TaxID=1094350 RepID=A0A9P4YQF4_9HYPO|nr:solute carrier family 6 (neurotransmitter transporter, GABA) member 1 [Geosmithia morbida]KAF4120672.1 solute carrier family 6 (neurotransmitter transporter, GABA) member 1 [Geosmithia morbida]
MEAVRSFGRGLAGVPRSIAGAPRRMAELGPTGVARAVVNYLAPPPSKADDGRDQWPSRASFVLACMGGCAGMGNLLRYPSVVYNNYGLQWYIPYLLCVFLIAIPVLILEIAIGNAYRGGSVVAFNSLNHRTKGTGLAMLYIGFVVGPYFVANLAWIMIYFRNSFTSPLPWAGRATAFYEDVVAMTPLPVPGELSRDGSGIVSWVRYVGTDLLGETVGWTAFTWFLVWISIFRGCGLTGRVVYFTMGLPICIVIILIGRSCSLPNAADGVKLYFATWRSGALTDGQLWQTAMGQVFFSTGVGFGYFTSYASYNRKHSNAVVDSILVVSSNVIFENAAAFAVFGVVGFLGMHPDPAERLGSFTVGFLTLPEAVAKMPAANFWAVMLFFTLMVLGYSSAFAMLDAVVTLVTDAKPRWNRTAVVTSAVVLSFLLSLPYCAQFGYYLLTGIDRWINDVALVFVVWAECVCSTTVYRWHDIVDQVGLPAFSVYNFGFFGGQVIGVAVGQSVGPDAGAGVGFGIFIVSTAVAVLISKTPETRAPSFWSKNVFTSRFWYMAFYSGNQLRDDLNLIVGQGKNWKIPVFWSPLVRYIAAPALAIVFSFSYPAFYQLRNDPLHVLGFGVAHIGIVLILCGFILPKWYDVFIPPARRGEGKFHFGAQVEADQEEMERNVALEHGAARLESDHVDVVDPKRGTDHLSASVSNEKDAAK